ncbi:MAG TPA: hypothetical protein VGS20_15040 [Candidatus Acidoferrales bacterium]|nr:hypothetical protein [Candidatus Acidoferrales bacterium]
MGRCLYCAGELNEHALYCPRCMVPVPRPEPQRRPGTVTLLLAVFVATAVPCFLVIARQMRRPGLHSVAASVQAAGVGASGAVDQAQILIERCGPPDRDVSTADNDPPPPIPFRVLEYQDRHLQFGFVPGGGAKIGDPPPYRWALSGILDTATNQPITKDSAARRMSCLAGADGLGQPPSAPSTSPQP